MTILGGINKDHYVTKNISFGITMSLMQILSLCESMLYNLMVTPCRLHFLFVGWGWAVCILMWVSLSTSSILLIKVYIAINNRCLCLSKKKVLCRYVSIFSSIYCFRSALRLSVSINHLHRVFIPSRKASLSAT